MDTKIVRVADMNGQSEFLFMAGSLKPAKQCERTVCSSFNPIFGAIVREEYAFISCTFCHHEKEIHFFLFQIHFVHSK